MQKRYAAVLLAAALLTGCGSPAEPTVEALPPGSHTEAVTTRPVRATTTVSTTLTTIPQFPLTGFATLTTAPAETSSDETTETTAGQRVSIAPENIPAGLTQFLEAFCFYTADYNNRDINSPRDFFMMLMNGYLCDLSACGPAGEKTTGTDPRGRWDKSVRGKAIGWPQEKIDWVLTYIYHWSPADIANLVQLGNEDGNRLPNTAASFYLEKGAYYTLAYELDMRYAVAVDEVWSDGVYYYVTYHAEQTSGEESWDAGSFQAVLQYTNRDGTARYTAPPVAQSNTFPEGTATAQATTTTTTATTAATTGTTSAGETTGGTTSAFAPPAPTGDGLWTILRKSDKPIF